MKIRETMKDLRDILIAVVAVAVIALFFGFVAGLFFGGFRLAWRMCG